MTTTVEPVILTSNLGPVLQFYTELLDATEVHRFPQSGQPFYIRLRIGGSNLGFVADRGAAVDTGQRLLLSVGVEDVDGLLEGVVAAGGTVLGPPTNMPWGQRVAHVKDPDGNMLNLTQLL